MTISGDRKLISRIELPDEDFEPMPEGDKQRRNLSYMTEALKVWFDSQENVYVSGNLFIRYLEGLIEKRIAPDTFVVFGMSREERTSYSIWEDGGKVPDFVLEITSKGTVTKDTKQNPTIYRDLNVKEYFQYDPTGEYLKPALQGVRLEKGNYVNIAVSILPDHVLSLHSETLGLDLHLYPERGFRFYDPVSNQVLRTYAESESERESEQRARFQAELQRTFEQEARLEAEAIAEREKLIADQSLLAKKQAEVIADQSLLAKQQAEAIANQERLIANQERQQKEKLAAYLRSLGINPDEI